MEFRKGRSGEIVMTVRFITGAVGESPPEEILRLVSEDLAGRLRKLQTEGKCPLGSFAFQVAEATYDSHREGGETARLDLDWPTQTP